MRRPRPSSASLRFLWWEPKTAPIGLSGVMDGIGDLPAHSTLTSSG